MLPSSWNQVRHADYTNTGFDRGHLCPSDDCDSTAAENQTTFILTNIVPQAPTHNRQSWRLLEEYARKLVDQGNELYTIAGTAGAALWIAYPTIDMHYVLMGVGAEADDLPTVCIPKTGAWVIVDE